MKVLGISAFFHDAAAALVVDGVVIAAAQEERFSRIKQDKSLPLQAVEFCLRQGGLKIEDIDHIVFYEKPLRKFERLMVTQLREFPRGLGQFTRSMAQWLSKRLWIKGDLCKKLRCHPDQLLFSDHHLSHAASAFLCSPFDESAIITVDGVGEWATTSIYHGKSDATGSSIELLKELHFPHSIGLLYSTITAFLGFKVNEGEYKVMGLAPYGSPRFLDEFEELCQIHDDGALTMNEEYFSYQRHPTKAFSPKMETLLGKARVPGAPLPFPAQDDDTQRFADIAASLQAFTERYLACLAQEARRITQADNLCLAGGVALNCVANGNLARRDIFDELFVQAAAGDAGGALGAALYVTHCLHQLPRAKALENAFLGESYKSKDIEKFLGDCDVDFERFGTDEHLAKKTARLLSDGLVGGWFQGRFEWGPRALGARSILADPRSHSMQEKVNAKIKFREDFRPFAPAVLSEDAATWFELPRGGTDFLTPFMCAAVPVTEAGKRQLPATTHINGTARLQRVERESNPKFHRLLRAFKEKTGVGVLLNTSMNLKDEPICASPAEAIATFIRSDLDFLVLENCLIEKGDSHGIRKRSLSN